jgi:hypothetical protein
MKRRTLILAGLSAPFIPQQVFAAAPRMNVVKTPTCGCCTAWVDHVRSAGFLIDIADVTQEALWALKESLSITPELASCHTARVEGYFIEGHVPADDISRLLAERPDALGLTVPGMPIGSPGMEMGAQSDAFDTLLVMRDGSTQVFEHHA